MTPELLREIVIELDKLVLEHLDRNPGLRRAAELAGRWLLEAARDSAARAGDARAPQARPGPAPADQPAAEARPAPASVSESPPELRKQSLHLAIGNTRVAVDVHGTEEEIARARMAAQSSAGQGPTRYDSAAFSDLELALVETRCRLKAASCTLFIERRAADEGSDAEREVLGRMNAMIAEAKALPNCYLWVFRRDRTPPGDAALLGIAAAYAAHADAAAMTHRLVTEHSPAEQSEYAEDAFSLLAASNSTLRVALGDTWISSDRDQEDVHQWLRRESLARQIYLERHMRIDDPADPAELPGLQVRIHALAERIDGRRSMEKEVRSALKKLQYEANRLVRDGDDPEMLEGHVAKMEQVLDELARMGVPESSRDVAACIDAAAQQRLREIPALNGRLKRALSAARPVAMARAVRTTNAAPAWSRTVLDVRALLQGTRVVVLGGEPRADAAGRLEEAFELAELEWVELTEHGPGQPMVAPIQRADTVLVLCIIKLVGHLHLEEARTIAAEAGKPCVLLTGGYNPEVVAQAVLDQASERLRTRLQEI